jgi:hypothetical protein
MTRCIRLCARIADKAEDLAIRQARDDLRLAANRTITGLYIGTDGVPPHTAAYRMMSGIKGHSATYVATTQTVSGGVRSAVATHVYDRWRTDRRDIEAGRKSLATFRRLPLLMRRQEVEVIDHEHVALLIWGRAPGQAPRWVRVEVWPTGRRYRSLWRRIVGHEVQHGDARLQMDRLHRWYLLLSYSEDVEERSASGGTLTLTLTGECWHAVHTSPDGEVIDERDFRPSGQFWLAWSRELQLFRQIGECNRQEYEVRTGRGRGAKIAPLERRRDKYRLRIEDMCRVMAAAIVRYAVQEKCSIVLPKLKGEAVRQQNRTEDVRPRETRAVLRSRFLRRQRGKVEELIRSAAEHHGVSLL